MKIEITKISITKKGTSIKIKIDIPNNNELRK